MNRLMLVPEFQVAKFKKNVGEQRLLISEERLSLLLNRADQARQSTTGDSFTFKDWVYSLEHPRRELPVSHRPSFLGQARVRISNVLDRIADGRVGAWDLVFCDDGTKEHPSYKSQILQRNGRPLALRPDAVLKNRAMDLWVIFEYKIPTPGVRIPLEGWPNLAAQLWSYSWAGPWANSPNVILVGALFDWDGVGATLGSVCPRTVKTDPLLCRACSALFRSWGGDVELRTVSNPLLKRLLSLA